MDCQSPRHAGAHGEVGASQVDKVYLGGAEAKGSGQFVPESFSAAKRSQPVCAIGPLQGNIPVALRLGSASGAAAHQDGKLKLWLILQDGRKLFGRRCDSISHGSVNFPSSPT